MDSPLSHLFDFSRISFLQHKQNSPEWELERRDGIGSSDLSKLLASNEYSCKRELAYDKLGFKPDYARRHSYALSRGHRQEPVARDYYSQKTNRNITAGFRGALLKARPYIRASIDGVFQEAGEFGVLEIKTLGKDSYLEKKNNLPEEYIAQVQYSAGILGLPKTSIVLFCPDQDAITWVDSPADPEIFTGLVNIVTDFWENHIEKNVLPEPLDSGTPVCRSCVYRKTCKGMNSRGEIKD